MTITKRLSTVLVFIFTALALNAQAQQSTEPPLITVTGQAEVKVAPDEAVFNIVVEYTDKDMLAAKNANDESVRKILAFARTYNIEPQNVQTDYISVEPKYNTDDDDETKMKKVFIGYSVSKTVVIRLRDLTRFENLFSDILKAGVMRIRDIDFRTTQLRQHKDRARAMAIKAAQEKAIALTKEIGQTIGRAYSIREDGYDGGNARSNNSFVVSGNYSDNESTFAPGLISITAQVTVSFRLL